MRYIGPVCKLCRREGMKLFLKGEKCFTKCTLEKRKEIPGMHGKGFRGKKTSEYNKRLREKQKLKRMINVAEKPFRRYFAWAQRQPGLTGVSLLRFLETRLDNVVHRLGFTTSKQAARQMVLHGHIEVNGKTVGIPSFQLKPGDKVVLKSGARENVHFKKWWELNHKNPAIPTWLENDAEYSGVVKSWPMREDSSFPVNDQLIVELYSK